MCYVYKRKKKKKDYCRDQNLGTHLAQNEKCWVRLGEFLPLSGDFQHPIWCQLLRVYELSLMVKSRCFGEWKCVWLCLWMRVCLHVSMWERVGQPWQVGLSFRKVAHPWMLFSVASDSIPEHDLRRLLGEARKGSRRLFCFWLANRIHERSRILNWVSVMRWWLEIKKNENSIGEDVEKQLFNTLHIEMYFMIAFSRAQLCINMYIPFSPAFHL